MKFLLYGSQFSCGISKPGFMAGDLVFQIVPAPAQAGDFALHRLIMR